MGAAITLLVILTVSVVVVRAAAVALRLTGMPVEVARFQARSAFTGTGFTTSESEAIVNYPIRNGRHVPAAFLAGGRGRFPLVRRAQSARRPPHVRCHQLVVEKDNLSGGARPSDFVADCKWFQRRRT